MKFSEISLTKWHTSKVATWTYLLYRKNVPFSTKER